VYSCWSKGNTVLDLKGKRRERREEKRAEGAVGTKVY